MNLAHVNIAIRQRSVLESVDLSLPFCLRLGKRLYGRLALITLLPLWALCVGLGYAFELNWFLLWMIAFALQSLAQGIFTLAAGRLVFEGEVSAKAILRDYMSRLPSYAIGLLWTRTLIVLTLATFMLLLPIAWIRYAYSHEVLLLEQATLRKLGSRSGAIVKGHTGIAAQTIVCLLCITLAGILACELLGTGIVSYLLQLGSPFGSLFEDGGSVYSLLGLFLTAPLVATARFLSYIDGRTRRDAWDIQVRFQQVRAEAHAKVL